MDKCAAYFLLRPVDLPSLLVNTPLCPGKLIQMNGINRTLVLLFLTVLKYIQGTSEK